MADSTSPPHAAGHGGDRKGMSDAEDFFEHAAVGMRLVAADGTILRANQAELDLLGYRRDEYVGHNLADFDADDDNLCALLARVRAGESVDKRPARLIGGDGRVRQVQISSSGRFERGQFVHSRCITIDVKEQNSRQRATAERGRLSQQLLQALPIAVHGTDAGGAITFFNEAAVELAGRRPMPGEKWCLFARLFQADGAPLPHEQCAMARAVREARAIHGDIALAQRADGRRIAFAAYSTPLFDGGVLTGAVNMLVDIPDPREAGQASKDLNSHLKRRMAERTRVAEAGMAGVSRSERYFQLLVSNVTDYAIFMLDPRGIITNWNTGAERIKGYRAEEIIGQHFSCFYPPEERSRGTPQTALETARREGHYVAEGWRVRKDGSRFWASVVIDPIYDDGVLVGYAKITRDISRRRQAETALAESDQLARGIIDSALDGFAQLDGAGRIVRWNPQAEAMFGWSRAEARGKPLATLVGPPGHPERLLADLEPSPARGARRGATRQSEMVNRVGETIPVELSVSSLSLHGESRTNVFIRDLSEKIRIEAQLRQAQKMEAVGQLTGGLAHDFNNLLQGIIGSLDLIQLHASSGDAATLQRFVQGALNSANRAAATTHRLLAFSRRQPLDPRPVAANPLIASMEELLRRTLGEAVTLRFELADDLWLTLCDPNQLESALLNLTINARDAMPDGGDLLIRSSNLDAGSIESSNWLEADSGQYICIEVVDNGTGMAPEVLEHAFEPFFTTKPTGRGTGLGLSMVYGFARQSNGYCDIRSAAGEGTSIKLYLPRHVELARPGHDQAEATPRPSNGEVVLVVEDEQVVRQVVVEVLHQLGYAVLEAPDADAALAALESHGHLHMLISDISLPGMSGRSLADTLRARQPELKVLLMTGYAADAASSKGFAAGMELITKPFTVSALTERLQRMLGDVADGDDAN
ncbi:PAS domain S-box protein [Rhodanobacter sp. UC4451_H18]